MPVFGGGKLHLLQERLSMFSRNEAEGGSFVNGRESFTSLLKKFIVSLCGTWFSFFSEYCKYHNIYSILPNGGASNRISDEPLYVCPGAKLYFFF